MSDDCDNREWAGSRGYGPRGSKVCDACIPTVRIELFWFWEYGRVTVHQMGLGRYHGACGKMVAFDRAAACGDEAGLIGFDCFDAGGRDGVSGRGSYGRKRRWKLGREEKRKRVCRASVAWRRRDEGWVCALSPYIFGDPFWTTFICGMGRFTDVRLPVSAR